MADDLTTIVGVELDTSGLDSLNSNTDIDFSELVDTIAQSLNTGCIEAAQRLSEKVHSFQEQFIYSNGSIITGGLINSISETETDTMTWTIEPTVEYATYVEHGRGEVRPVYAKCLHYFDGGEEIFTKYSGPAMAKPFVYPAWEQIESEAIGIVEESISNNLE